MKEHMIRKVCVCVFGAYQCPVEVSGCFVPGAAGRGVPADVDVVHQSVTVQKTLP